MNTYVLFALLVIGVAVAIPRVKRQAYYLPADAELIVGTVKTTFKCDNLREGYYADTDNDCKVFHVCHPIKHEDGTEETLHYSFYCGNQTVFDQGTLVCSHPEDAVKCSEAKSFYYINEKIGIEDAPLLTSDDTVKILAART